MFIWSLMVKESSMNEVVFLWKFYDRANFSTHKKKNSQANFKAHNSHILEWFFTVFLGLRARKFLDK